MSDRIGPRVLVVGAGYVGLEAARVLRGRGWSPRLVVRSEESRARLAAEGWDVVAGDAAAGTAWREDEPAPEAIIVAVSAGGPGVETYRAAYVDSLEALRERARAAGGVRVLAYTSSTGVHPRADGGICTEDDPRTEPTSRGGTGTAAVLRDAEDVVEAGVADGAWRSGIVLRLAGIYGPGRHHLLDALRRGDTEVAGGGDHRMNLIHRDDAAAAIAAVLESAREGFHAYLVADGRPATKAELMGWLAARLGRPPPVFRPDLVPARRAGRGGGSVPDRVIVPDRLRRETGWKPSFRDFRAYYAELLSE